MVQNDPKQEIQMLAQTHGFALCAFTHPQVNAIDQEALDRWVDAKMYGDMDYMGEEIRTHRRKNPATMLDDIQTVISLGMPYSPPNHKHAIPQQGIIASYARGDDYHELMKKKLKALARDLDALLGQHGQRVYVDTAPVLEHALAAKGGLAWQGKHSLSINREYGSWFFLAELFTTANIEPDTEATLHCGTCTDCIPACPTGAIVSPYVVDARLCISYLTIEFKGFIPENLRKAMGNRIFGCDDCQTICPWNSKVKAPSNDFLKPREDTFLPELAMLLSLDDEGFRQMFRKSAIKRTKRAGLLRNVCIAMGNSGDVSFVPQLLGVLDDNEPLIRGHAVWALGQLASQQQDVQKHIQLLKEKEQHNEILAEIASFERKT
ncbi:tRNA epoxyqueuosine(34) reductase QueG [Ghiorsea bivora]|uniref:tRNA epoxyqueuosine(34) reductase QueG n=1 Tax=Ghiorsea bivora TaxID=1485545 RepID=UPI00057047B6|nr:tRNA epoxyqueuosine(34) reductase QueG [Ghiorsea bivora]